VLHVRVNVPPDPGALEALVEGVVRLNVWYLAVADDSGVELPPLYESGIVYRREPPGEEWWETVRDLRGLVSHRSGDCEDLAAARAAELRYFDEEHEARVRVVRTSRGTFHAVVQRADGSIEDPSRILVNIEREARTQ
jgi:hypothetical protein